jgi:hypothetical protein
MRALVVYESMFGNTRNVALAIAEGIAATMPVEALEVGVAPAALPADVALVVVGGPTHAHGMSTARSRLSAAQRIDGTLISKSSGLREWLASLRAGGEVTAAAFDTRIKGPMIFTGSAARSATRLIRKMGVRRVEEPHSFVLDGATGPLVDRVTTNELDAARAWGAVLAAKVATTA